VLEAIADRERELTGDAPEPDTADPVPATDGGQTVTPDDEDDVDDESSGDDLHPDTKGLVAGEVTDPRDGRPHGVHLSGDG